MQQTKLACLWARDGPMDLYRIAALVSNRAVLLAPFSSACIDEVETLLGSCPEIDAPCVAELVLAILLFAGDVALFSYSVPGL